jgi:hypothetical protein
MILFERKYPVNVFNTDLTGRLSPGALFSFFEDLAGRHAAELGWGRDDLMASGGYFWALSRMIVKIERLPIHGTKSPSVPGPEAPKQSSPCVTLKCMMMPEEKSPEPHHPG